ncbi:ribosome biogenesis protein Nop53/GLTSCR2 [Scheffersomyces xylosifermentans]|uniref:ribosome biogenesis protein Nop53/GLTSCR2 n=1 Tax=Scheffersomyces xylosifermentans TaxID=1304137 RepID=UPI00315D73D2
MAGTSKTAGRKPQPSRKGKKAWRKNVDIEDVEAGLQENYENEVHLGTKRKSTDVDEEDFVIDSSPSSTIASKRPEKKLKTKEILTNKSKVDALVNPKASKVVNNTIQGVKKTEVLRLMKLAGGKYKDESKIKNRIDKDGLIHVKNKDLWGAEEEAEVAEKSNTPIANFSSTSEFTVASVVPKTLKTAPIKILENDLNKKIVDAGKSYNPSLESWKSLINKEHGIEYKRELNRQKMAEHREKIQDLINTLDDNESDSEDDEKEEVAEEATEADYKLSINKPTQVKIKTKTKRNRIEKHKKRELLQQELKELKKQLKDLTNLDQILEKEEKTEKKTKTKNSNKPKKLFKYDAVQAPLEVKLSDELTNNLKNLKPEGNLFYDQMLNLQSTGKIETRIPVSKRRKYTPKITEKWTYKDFK